MGFRLTVEVPLFLTYFGFLLTDSVNTNLMIFRTCYVTLGFDKHNCSLLGNTTNNITKELEKLVQPKADIISMVKTIVDTVSAAVLCVFVGSWCDRFGRKPVLVSNLIGYTLMNLVMVVFSAIDTASPWFMMTCSIPVILTGGGASLLTVFLAYLTDITTEEERGFRMGFFEVVMAIAVLLGSSSSSYVLNATSYVTVFAIASATCFLALVYTVFFLPESLEVRETSGRLKGFFQLRNISGMFRTTFKSRPNFNRAIILLIVLALALYYTTIFGDGSVMFLFVRQKFHWTLRQYTWYTSANNIMWISGTLFIVYLVHHKLHVKEAVLILAGFASFVIGALIQGLAQADWLLYVASVVKIPSSALSPMTRSLLSKLVHVDEAGKIFGVFNVLQNLLGLIGSPVYTTLYNATIDTDPGMFNYITSAVHGVNTICLACVLMLQKRIAQHGSYSVMENENTQNDVEDDVNHSSDLVVNS